MSEQYNAHTHAPQEEEEGSIAAHTRQDDTAGNFKKSTCIFKLDHQNRTNSLYGSKGTVLGEKGCLAIRIELQPLLSLDCWNYFLQKVTRNRKLQKVTNRMKQQDYNY
ncbi:hypothetical protein KQX54_018525 [Cotesia glomerata]|uniref:Uncharacterized protein n=1 Tax=Cotesia glomerata TaxID=32391 RepID=A0AAV7IZ36_COTGL|nr:hypothetical protein KQX54_018525 [Cotesia glomerata]